MIPSRTVANGGESRASSTAAGTYPLKTRTIGLPAKCFAKILDFLEEGKTGKVTLNVKDGSILTWSIEEVGRG